LALDVAPLLKLVDRTVRRGGRVGALALAGWAVCSLAVRARNVIAAGVGRAARVVADLARDNIGERWALLDAAT
jgi:hypothetical protein